VLTKIIDVRTGRLIETGIRSGALDEGEAISTKEGMKGDYIFDAGLKLGGNSMPS
jgi:hypothetical protein